jgi:hypothetical protein
MLGLIIVAWLILMLIPIIVFVRGVPLVWPDPKGRPAAFWQRRAVHLMIFLAIVFGTAAVLAATA